MFQQFVFPWMWTFHMTSIVIDFRIVCPLECMFILFQTIAEQTSWPYRTFISTGCVKEKERERDGKSKYSQTHRLFKLCNKVLSLLVNLVILYSLPIPCSNLTNNRQNGLTINQLSHDLRIELFISHLMGHHYYYWARTCANKFCSWKVKYPSTCGWQLF